MSQVACEFLGACSKRWIEWTIVCGAVLGGCTGGDLVSGSGDEAAIGEISAELATVPGNVSCVRMVVSPGPKTMLFDVVPGEDSVDLNIGELQFGTTTIEASAFSVPCNLVTTGRVPEWVGKPVTVDVKPGVIPQIRLTLVPNSTSNVDVDFVEPAVALATGYGSSFAVSAAGDVHGWGFNAYSQLDDGTTTDRTSSTPTLLHQVASISGGVAHTCAVTTSGALRCWGDNTFGALGDGTTTSRSTPVEVIASGVAEVSLGYYHTCARMLNGDVRCAGENNFGQLGNGTLTNSPSFVTVLSSAAEIAAGGYHNCARTTDGGVYCWGYNALSQVGGAAGAPVVYPKYVTQAAVELSLGGYHSCLRKANGTVWCWGNNLSGQLGIGNTISPQTAPVQVTLSGALSIAAGGYFTCARTQSGALCWGDNYFGEVGDGSAPANKLYPTSVLGLAGVEEIVAGAEFACARLDTGGISCWGHNPYGQVGDGTLETRYSPVPVLR